MNQLELLECELKKIAKPGKLDLEKKLEKLRIEKKLAKLRLAALDNPVIRNDQN